MRPFSPGRCPGLEFANAFGVGPANQIPNCHIYSEVPSHSLPRFGKSHAQAIKPSNEMALTIAP
jgi:hypothetical protein